MAGDEQQPDYQNHPFFQISQKIAENRYEHDKLFLQTSWRETTKEGVCEYFMQWAINDANHAAQCTEPSCGFCMGRRVTFCNPSLFVKLIQQRLAIYETVSEAKDLAELWSTKDLVKLEMDPRYIVFRCNWDETLVAIAVVRETMQDVFGNMGIQHD